MRKIKLLFISLIVFLSVNVHAQSYDSDAQAFFTAAGITNDTLKNAVNQLVVGLKNASLWSKMKAIYPFVGGTASSHKWNLKDPRDLDTAYRLTFLYNNYPASHSSTGVLWDQGTDNQSYANTHFSLTQLNSINSSHLSVYIRTNTAGYGNDIGVYDYSTAGFGINSRYVNDNCYLDLSSGKRISAVNADSRGFYLVSRTSSSSVSGYKNDTLLSTNTGSETYPASTYNLFLGALNNNGNPSSFSHRECSFASIGEGLSGTEASAYYQIVQTYQCNLSRAIDSCFNNGGGPVDSTGIDTNWVRSGNNLYYNNGNVGIGTANPQQKLSVNGTILAKKVKVSIQSTDWPDYVFDKNYKLPTLDETEKFIKLNKHLPGIPSAKEVEKNGLDLGINQALLLKKIEELTLLLIRQNKKIIKQDKRIEILENRIIKNKD